MKEIRITELAHNRLMIILAKWIKSESWGSTADGCLAGTDKRGIIKDIVKIRRYDGGGCDTMGEFTQEFMNIAMSRLMTQKLIVYNFIRIGADMCDTEDIGGHVQQINAYGLNFLSVSAREISECTGDYEYSDIKYTIIPKKERRVKRHEKEIPVCSEREGLSANETGRAVLVQN